MINSSNFTFEVSYSISSYNAKPSSDQIKYMHFAMSKTNVNEFVNKISSVMLIVQFIILMILECLKKGFKFRLYIGYFC